MLCVACFFLIHSWIMQLRGIKHSGLNWKSTLKKSLVTFCVSKRNGNPHEWRFRCTSTQGLVNLYWGQTKLSQWSSSIPLKQVTIAQMINVRDAKWRWQGVLRVSLPPSWRSLTSADVTLRRQRSKASWHWREPEPFLCSFTWVVHAALSLNTQKLMTWWN